MAVETNLTSPVLMMIMIIVPLLFSFVYYWRQISRSLPLPPAPFSWPVIGNLYQISGTGSHLPASLATLAQTHGPLMSLRLGTQLLVVGSSPEAAKQLLKTHDRILSGRHVGHWTPFRSPELNHLSMGFSYECTNRWKSLRALFKTELFSSRAMEDASQVALREKKVMEMVAFLAGMEGRAVAIGDLVSVPITNILSNALLSVDFLDFEGNGVGAELKNLIRKNGEVAMTPNLADLFPVLAWFDFQGLKKKSLETIGRFHAMWGDIVKERRKLVGQVSNHRDFLDALLESQFSDEQITQLLTELFSGGTDTSSITIEWMMAELIKNPNSSHKLRQELEHVVGKGKMVKETDLANLPYLQACVNEAMRLHPPGPLLLPHRAVETCQVMGYTIPKDTQVLVNTFAIGRDPESWKDPLRFDPERFIDSGLDFKGNSFQHIPFGAGRRICPGMPLGARQVSLIVASLVHWFDWSLPGDMEASELDMDEMCGLTLQRMQPLYLIPKNPKYMPV